MRGCGVLLHITSLPGKGGVGSLGQEAHAFVDFLSAAGQSWWQVLPLTPPARGNSPYSAYSVFAGNPALINLEQLEQEGLLAFWSRKFLPKHCGEEANFNFCHKIHLPMLRQSFASGYEKKQKEVEEFRRKNAYWLEDYALFMAVQEQQGGAVLADWPDALRLRQPDALEKARDELRAEVNFWVWTQFLFFRQWNALRQYANQNGVRIIGDMPLYPAMDSAEVWANPEVFQLDEERKPRVVAGVPPDAFSSDGQLWGNPLYNWDALKNDNYRWWVERLALATQMYDRVRIDHFRALDTYYAVPIDAATAREGSWQQGPGMDFIRAIRAQVPDCDLIAEDLGEITDGVRHLLAESGLPGMKVLQFAFDPTADSEHLPHYFVRNCVGYTGTHDNNTVQGWLREVSDEELDFIRQYLRLTRREGYHWGVIRALYATTADTVIVPLQDFMGLDSQARMNVPGVAEGQWNWRADTRRISKRLAVRMRELAALYRRLPAAKSAADASNPSTSVESK